MRNLWIIVFHLLSFSGTWGQEPSGGNEVNVRLIEHFDEVRTPSRYQHPETVRLKTAAGPVSYNSECIWKEKQEEPLPPIWSFQEEEEVLKISPEEEGTLTPIPFSLTGVREGGITFEIDDFPALSPSTGDAVSFSEIETEGLSGFSLSGPVKLWEGLECLLFVSYGGGNFEGTERVHIPGFYYYPFGEEIGGGDDTFTLTGEMTSLRFGIAPLLYRAPLLGETVMVDLFLAAGYSRSTLEGMEVRRTGTTEETFQLPDETLTGFFLGPLLRATVRISGPLRLELGGEYIRSLGDLAGSGVGVTAGLRVEF